MDQQSSGSLARPQRVALRSLLRKHTHVACSAGRQICHRKITREDQSLRASYFIQPATRSLLRVFNEIWSYLTSLPHVSSSLPSPLSPMSTEGKTSDFNQHADAAIRHAVPHHPHSSVYLLTCYRLSSSFAHMVASSWSLNTEV